MQLNPGEKSILAYFHEAEQAQQAVQSLQAMGYHDLEITSLSPYSRRPLPRSSSSYLSSLVLGNRGDGEYNPGHGPLMAADPAVSGMSSPDPAVAEPTCLLTLVCSTEAAPAALEVLKQHGAQV
jgi:hypothetical protein